MEKIYLYEHLKGFPGLFLSQKRIKCGLWKFRWPHRLLSLPILHPLLFFLFSGPGTSTIVRFRVFASVHCEQSMYFTRIYDETLWWTKNSNVFGCFVYDFICFHENFSQPLFRRFIYTTSFTLEPLPQYIFTPCFDSNLYYR